ncbi:MAG: cytochrome c oxidase assembly protein [Acidimicrobiia bacterium]
MTPAPRTAVPPGLVARARRWAPAAGVLAAVAAVSPPVESWAGAGTGHHMVQHLGLIVIVAPLLAVAAAVSPPARGIVGRAPVASLAGAAALHAGTVAFWHVPGPYDAAVDATPLHAVEHLTLLGGAVALWAALAIAGQRSPLVALAAIFVSAVVATGIGALLTFAPRPVYELSSTTADPLRDQQLAGLIMWVPGGIPYVAAAAVVIGAAVVRATGERGPVVAPGLRSAAPGVREAAGGAPAAGRASGGRPPGGGGPAEVGR